VLIVDFVVDIFLVVHGEVEVFIIGLAASGLALGACPRSFR
jgi:hypothetical protein